MSKETTITVPTKTIDFAVTDEHLKLIKALNFRPKVRVHKNTLSFDIWPSIDKADPFDCNKPHDILPGACESACDILGYRNADGSIDPDKYDKAALLTIQVPVALECMVQAGKLEPGVYQASCDRYGAYIEYCKVARVLFWHKAVTACVDENSKTTIINDLRDYRSDIAGNPYGVLTYLRNMTHKYPGKRIELSIFEEEAVRQYRAATGDQKSDPNEILHKLVSGQAGMTFPDWPF